MKNCKKCVFCKEDDYGYVQGVRRHVVIYTCKIFKHILYHYNIRAMFCDRYLPKYLYEEAQFRNNGV